MIKLFASPGSCSLCAHVVLLEGGLPHKVEYVVLRSPNSPLPSINPLGKVPTLVLPSGEVVTQSIVVLPYLADLAPDTGLLPHDPRDRRAVLQWLGFFNSDVHPALKPVAGPERYSSDPETLRSNYIQIVGGFFAVVDRALAGSRYLTGNAFTIADIYGCAAFGWARKFRMPLGDYPNFERLSREFEDRESVRRARAMEQAFLDKGLAAA